MSCKKDMMVDRARLIDSLGCISRLIEENRST